MTPTNRIRVGTRVTIPALGGVAGTVTAPYRSGGFRFDDDSTEFDQVVVDLGAAGDWRGPVDMLAPVLPPEPRVGVFAVVELTDRVGLPAQDRLEVWRRWWGTSWSPVNSNQDVTDTWAGLHNRGLVTVLVPCIAQDAPALPWRFPSPSDDDPNREVIIDRDRDAGDALTITLTGSYLVRLPANRIRALAAVCQRHLLPGAERDSLLAVAVQDV